MLADDDERVRRYVRTLLATDESVEVVGEAADGEGALQLVTALDPDLLLVDVVMPGLNGIAATRRALAVNRHLKVLVFSLHKDKRLVTAAIEAGAAGYLLKDHLDEELLLALSALGGRQVYLSPDLGLS